MFSRDNVQKILESKGWTNYRLAKESGLGQSTIHEIMNGKKKTPTSETVQKISNALQVPMDELFDGQNDEIIIGVKKNDNNLYEQQCDISRIERARNKMPSADRDRMMKILEAAFDEYFKD